MAKKKGRRAFRKYLAGKINHSQLLGTLTAKSAISAVVAETLSEKAWLSSVKATWAVGDWTPAAGDGPIMVGVAHSDYSTSEIEAWIENSGSWSQGDKVTQEIGRRKIRRVGVLQSPVNTTEGVVLNDGKPITTKCNWQLITGQSVRIWAYNMGISAFATTDPLVVVNGHANLWPN